jgi:hypothetical protein
MLNFPAGQLFKGLLVLLQDTCQLRMRSPWFAVAGLVFFGVGVVVDVACDATNQVLLEPAAKVSVVSSAENIRIGYFLKEVDPQSPLPEVFNLFFRWTKAGGSQFGSTERERFWSLDQL